MNEMTSENWEEVEKKCNLLAETRGSRLLAIEGSGVHAWNVEEHHGRLPEERKRKSRRLRLKRKCASERKVRRVFIGGRKREGEEGEEDLNEWSLQ